MHLCDFCDKSFGTERGLRSHQGVKHDIVSSKIEKTCENCSELFRVPDSESDRKYCSQECYHNSSNVDTKCVNCGEEMVVSECRYNSYNNIFCDGACRQEFESTSMTCSYCGDEISVQRHRRLQNNRSYCSVKCYNQFRENDIALSRGERKRWAKTVKQRDNYRCQECDSTNDLHAHHKIPISENEELASDPSNGITLCKECHADKHKQLGDVNPNLILSSGGSDGY